MGRPGTGDQVHVDTFQDRTDQNGVLRVDVTRFITTTNGSKSVLVEGQVQDLSNQAVANSSTVVVHQPALHRPARGELCRHGQRASDRHRAHRGVDGRQDDAERGGQLKFVRRDWVEPRTYGEEWKVNEVEVGQARVTTDAQGRATYLFTPPTAGDYRIIAESRDARGNAIKSSMGFWAASDDPGYVPWRMKNEQQIQLVADKEQYRVGDTARIWSHRPTPRPRAS